MSILDNCCNVVMLCFSAVAWQITLSHPENQKAASRVQGHPDGTNSHEADLCVLLFRSLISSDTTVIPNSLQFTISASFRYILSYSLVIIYRYNKPISHLHMRLAISQEIEFIKRGNFTSKELDALVSALELARQNKVSDKRSIGGSPQKPSAAKSIASLEAMGVRIYGLNEPNLDHSKTEISWDNIAGYNQQKRYAIIY